MSQWRTSLTAKLLVFQILGFALILTVSGALRYQNVRLQIYNEIENGGKSVGQAFQEMVNEYPYLFNPQALEPLVLRFTVKLTNFYHISVVDHNGHVLADSNPAMVGTDIDQRTIFSALQESGETSSFYSEDGHRYLQLRYLLTGPYDPVRKSTVIGAVTLVLHLSNAESRIHAEFMRTMLIVGALFLGFWVLQYFAISRGLLRGLQTLTLVTKRFGAGEFSARATVPTHDEVGRLAETFNRMATEIQNNNTALQSEIAERKQTEAALAESETRYRDLFGSASDIILSFSLEGMILKVNRALEESMGWSPQEVVGEHFHKLLTPASSMLAEESMHRVLNEKLSFFTTELEGRCKEGNIILLEVRLRLLSDKEGSPAGFEGICRDITARKRTEAAVRTAEAAEEASRLKSDFLATISHEIRTPLNGVLGMLEVLLDTNLSDTQHELAETARNSGYILLTLINDILDFSKIEAGKLEIELLPFDLRLVVEELAEIMATKVEDKGLEFIVRYPPNAPRQVVGDSGRIRQVIMNLVGNAVKFTEKGDIILNVEGAEQNTESTRLRFTVTDTGIGIPDEKLESIFDRFTQADTSIGRRFGGAGLGLAISKRLVELMGGTIGVTSRLGEGSTFWFELPLPVGTQELHAPLPAADLRGVRVLVVDDNAENRQVLHEYLMSWNMRNGTFATGADALTVMHHAHADGDPYQLALIDSRMPTIDGEALGRAIKADPALCETVLVLLTLWSQQEGGAEWLAQAGFAAAIHKPVRPSRLFDVLVDCWSAHLHGQQPTILTRSAYGVASAAQNKVLPRAASSFPARVLVVEDNTINQKVARLMLEGLGCRIDVAANGKEAVAMVTMAPYDVVFMDCEMPEMDGFEASVEIRRRESKSQHLPIVAMTANAMKGVRERCLQAGMDDYLSKPIEKEGLRTMLQRWAPKTEQASVAAAPLAMIMAGEVGGKGERETPSSVLDPERLQMLQTLARRAKPGLYHQLLQNFQSNAVPRIAALREAIAKEDSRSLRQVSHTLKGAALNIGATGVGKICQQLEDLGDAHTVEGAAALLEELDCEYLRVQHEIARELARPGPISVSGLTLETPTIL